MGLLWLGVVPLVSGLVAQAFGTRFMTTLVGIAFFSHQVGSFLGAWAGGLIYDALGSYDRAWQAAVAIGLVAGAAQVTFGRFGPSAPSAHAQHPPRAGRHTGLNTPHVQPRTTRMTNDTMQAQMQAQMATKGGFIAALDQSGGSTPGALRQYGIADGAYANDEDMFRLMHEMRVRIIAAPAFTGRKSHRRHPVRAHHGRPGAWASPCRPFSGRTAASSRSSRWTRGSRPSRTACR